MGSTVLQIAYAYYFAGAVFFLAAGIFGCLRMLWRE